MPEPGPYETRGEQRERSYQPLFELSRGGMGRVELAMLRGPRFSRLYAIKRLHPHLAEDPAVREMFLDEGRLAGLVRHPNVVSVLDVGEDTLGPFLVMDFIDGVPLSALIPRAQAEPGGLPVALCVRVAADVARGLHAAHELRDPTGNTLGLIHRDVSPQNILVGFDGLTRVTDFGVAKALDTGNRTSTGMLKGKMGYMAPERLRFEAFDRRVDLFSLGVVLHEMLAGQRLYQGAPGAEGTDVARRILDEPAPDIGLVRDDVPGPLCELLFQLLAKDPALRPTDAAEVAARLGLVAEELAAVQGGCDVGRFVTERFAAEREIRERKVRETLSATDSATERAGAAPRSLAPFRRRWAMAAGGLAVAGALAWGGRSLLAGARTPARPRAATVTPPPPATPEAIPAAPAPSVVVPAAPLVPARPAATHAASPARHPARTRPAKPAAKPVTSKPAGAIPMWKWR